MLTVARCTHGHFISGLTTVLVSQKNALCWKMPSTSVFRRKCGHAVPENSLLCQAQLCLPKYFDEDGNKSNYKLLSITNLMYNFFILQSHLYTIFLNMFRASMCSSSGGKKIVCLQYLVSSHSVSCHTVPCTD